MPSIAPRFHRIALAIPFLLGPAAALAEPRSGWTFSSGPVNPCESVGNFLPGAPATIYLWYAYSFPDTPSGASITWEFDPPGAATFLGFQPNGWVCIDCVQGQTIGTPLSGCPQGPVLVGSLLLLPLQPSWEICFADESFAVSCDVNPTMHPIDFRGFANGASAPPCSNGMDESCQPIGPVAVDRTTWGRAKGLYR